MRHTKCQAPLPAGRGVRISQKRKRFVPERLRLRGTWIPLVPLQKLITKKITRAIQATSYSALDHLLPRQFSRLSIWNTKTSSFPITCILYICLSAFESWIMNSIEMRYLLHALLLVGDIWILNRGVNLRGSIQGNMREWRRWGKMNETVTTCSRSIHRCPLETRVNSGYVPSLLDFPQWTHSVVVVLSTIAVCFITYTRL